MRIELLLPHTHAGMRHDAGEVLDLDQSSARWLIERGVARAMDSGGKSRSTANHALPDPSDLTQGA